MNSYLLAQHLANDCGIATRRGLFCAHPYCWRLLGIPDEHVIDFENCEGPLTPGMIRVSFGIYNTEEVDMFLECLPAAIEAAKKELEEHNSSPTVIREYDPAY